MDELEAPVTHDTKGTVALPESLEVRQWRHSRPGAGSALPGSRPATDGDQPCPCGRSALVVFTTEEFGDVIWCGA
jgi:hypothetical protein